MSEWSGAPGKYWGIIGDGYAMLIDRTVDPELLHKLSACHSVGAMLDALAAHGIASLPGFCLVGYSEDRLTAYVRGGFSLRAEASWHDAFTVNGDRVRTWRETPIEGVSRFAMIGPDDWHRTDLPTRSYEAERRHLTVGVQSLSFAVCEQLAETEVPLITATSEPQQTAVLPEPANDTSTREATTDAFFAEVFGASDPEPEVVDVDPELQYEIPDDHTVVSSLEYSDTELAGGGRAQRSYGSLVLPGGDVMSIAGPVLVGRNPKDANSTGAELVAVFDPNGNISRTHARITPGEAGAYLEDLGSTNGTLLVTSTEEVLLRAGAQVVLNDGDQIILGGDAQLEYRRDS